MTATIVRTLCAATILTTATAAQNAPSGATVLQAGTQLVVVDVTVQDKEGHPIHGLKQLDFQVSENKQPQAIKSFDEHTVADLSHAKIQKLPPMPPGTFTDYTPVPEDSTLNILLLDTLNTPMTDQSYVRNQLQQYVKNAKPGTRIAIFGLTSHLILLQGFTSDPEILKNIVEHKLIPRASVLLDDPTGSNTDPNLLSDTMSSAGASASAVAATQQFEAETASFQTQLRTQYTLDAFNALARYLGTYSGRKNIIWFSGSFPLAIFPDLTLDDPFAVMADASDELRQTTSLLDRARVAVYPIDARGLQTVPMFAASRSGKGYAGNPGKMTSDISRFNQTNAQEHMTMDQIAEDTGGRAFYNTNGLADAVAKSLDSGANYYTLTYAPSNHDPKGEYRNIRVQLETAYASRGLKLTYRHGYYATDPHDRHSESALLSGPLTPPAPGSFAYAQSAMERGSPTPSEVLFKVRVLPHSTDTEDKVAEHNQPNPNPPMKAPFRRYDIDFATLTADLALPLKSDGRHHGGVEFLAFVYDTDGKLLNIEGQSVSMKLDADTFVQMMKSGFGFHLEVSAPAKGESFLRIGVHDLTSGHFGAVEIPTSTLAKLQPPPTPEPAKAPATPEPAPAPK